MYGHGFTRCLIEGLSGWLVERLIRAPGGWPGAFNVGDIRGIKFHQ